MKLFIPQAVIIYSTALAGLYGGIIATTTLTDSLKRKDLQC